MNVQELADALLHEIHSTPEYNVPPPPDLRRGGWGPLHLATFQIRRGSYCFASVELQAETSDRVAPSSTRQSTVEYVKCFTGVRDRQTEWRTGCLYLPPYYEARKILAIIQSFLELPEVFQTLLAEESRAKRDEAVGRRRCEAAFYPVLDALDAAGGLPEAFRNARGAS